MVTKVFLKIAKIAENIMPLFHNGSFDESLTRVFIVNIAMLSDTVKGL